VKPAPERPPLKALWVSLTCDLFESAWKRTSAGERPPSIEDFLHGAPEQGRGDLLRKLIILDIHYRCHSGETPQPPDYHCHFPQTRGADWLETACQAAIAPSPPSSTANEKAATPVFDFLRPPEGPDEIGWLGQYRVLKLLGQGGMGIVFLAEDSHLQRRVALKVIKPEAAGNLEVRQRFLREARAIAALKHDHVVIVYAVGQDQDVPYLAMELLQGQSLHDRLDKGPPLTVAEVLRIGLEAATGLAAVHESGLIHRDIKPANLWLEAPKGRVKLLDFGLARICRDEIRLTEVGTVLGTLDYMSPEQARALDLDARSDLFSLGCVLYRMCSGQLPFRGANALAVVTALAVDMPPPLRTQPHAETPAELAELVTRLLAKQPEDRPRSTQEVVAALEAIERGLAHAPSAPTRALAPEPASWDPFCETLLRSRLLPREEVASLRLRHAEETSGDSKGEQFARWLLDQQYLTRYQCQRLLDGHTDSFFLNEYRILDHVGEGRMAGVYKAAHRLGQVVAIKILPPAKAQDPETFGRFQREAELAVRLKHAHVVRTFQTGLADGQHYLVMEYLEGETLAEVLQRRGRLPPIEAVRLLHQALLGLQHLHEQKMIHRDLKPANLMLTARPEPGQADTSLHATLKVLDIGLGRELFTDDSASSTGPRASLSAEEREKLTTKESMLGTLEYMAPEQARDARRADIRSDIYSLGCVLYHCLTGQAPFADRHPERQILRHATEAPAPLRQFLPEAPEALQRMLDGMLAKKPDQRFATPLQAAHVLHAWLEHERLATQPAEVAAEQSASLRWLENKARPETRPPVAPAVSAPTSRSPVWPWLAVAAVAALLGFVGLMLALFR
jgi:eukaryotic-like serine/threonine-protein kinase